MTFLEIQNAVYRLVRDPNHTKFDLQTIKDRINEAERRYCILTKYSETKDTSYNTVIGQQEYTLPVDYGDLDAVFYLGVRLYEVRQENTIYPTPNNGTPNCYYIRTNKIGLDPVPTAVGQMTFLYHTIGGQMTIDADVPVIPKEDHYLLKYYTAFETALEADDSRSTAFFQIWQDGIEQAKHTTVDKAFEQFPVVGEPNSYYKNPNIDNEGIPPWRS